MVDKFTERYTTIFPPLHPVIQNNINDIVIHFRQINLAVLGMEGSFPSDRVMQIAISDRVVFQVVLGSQDITFDLYDASQI